MSCNHKIALVTGASSGIGLEFTRLLADRGYSLIVTARRQDRLDALKQALESECNVTVHVVTQDLSLPGSARQLYEKIKTLNLQVSIVINNAGFGMVGSFLEHEEARLSQMMQLNMNSLTELSYLFGKGMAAHGHGKILQVASVGAFQPCPHFASYCATKAYVLSLGEALYQEFKSQNVQVTTLCPGLTKSEFFDVLGNAPKGISLKMAMTSKQVALQALDALFAGKSSVTTGFLNKLNGFLIRFFPRSWAAGMAGRMMKSTFR